MNFYLTNSASILGGIVLLGAGSWLLVFGSANLAEKLGVSHLVIGATVVALGTSLPEFCAVVVAAWQGKADIGIGNIAGSNIQNVVLILGAAAIVLPSIPITRADINPATIIFFIGASLYLLITLLTRSSITRWDGLFLVISAVIFMVMSFRKAEV